MDATIAKSTRIGLGFASHPDAFQCGREAAQEAKNQLTGGAVSLVLIVGPSTVHFKDFIEGARLVLGEETLVVVPTERAFSTETALPNACFVAALQAPAMRTSIAAENLENDKLLRGTTALISHFRKARGNAAREFAHRGCLVFSSNLSAANDLPSLLAADMGLESWMVGAAAITRGETSMICSNQTISNGLVGIEFLSTDPWGIGSVAVSSFSVQADVYREALKTAVRDAAGQMPSHPPCFGLVLFDSTAGAKPPLPDDIMASAASVLPGVPLLGLLTTRHFVRRPQRSTAKENDSILVVLVPA